MNLIRVMRSSVLVVAVVITACAGSGPLLQQRAAAQSGSPQEAAVDRAFSLRQDASTLRDMARRRELEADVLAQGSQADQAVIARKRQLARDLRAEADDLEQRALEAEQAVPHGMVPQ